MSNILIEVRNRWKSVFRNMQKNRLKKLNYLLEHPTDEFKNKLRKQELDHLWRSDKHRKLIVFFDKVWAEYIELYTDSMKIVVDEVLRE